MNKKAVKDLTKILDPTNDNFYRYENTRTLSFNDLTDILNETKEQYRKLSLLAESKGKHNFIPNQRQALALKYLTDPNYQEVNKVALGGGVAGSKTTLAMFFAISECLSKPEIAIGVARATITSLIKTTYPSFLEMTQILNLPKKLWKYNAKDNVITFANGSKIYFIALSYRPSDPEYLFLRGYQLTHLIFEEANEMPEIAIRTLLTRYGRWNNNKLVDGKEVKVIPEKALFTFNPSKGYVYETFYKP